HCDLSPYIDNIRGNEGAPPPPSPSPSLPLVTAIFSYLLSWHQVHHHLQLNLWVQTEFFSCASTSISFVSATLSF
ncbi:hypothetical protein Q8G46_27830, partial [Klebsiella pneumoniae]|uniref:hypothetical protein n=1 Tax=Klebsiella pneumoniae TaxID=573 RepID=UPI003013D376